MSFKNYNINTFSGIISFSESTFKVLKDFDTIPDLGMANWTDQTFSFIHEDKDSIHTIKGFFEFCHEIAMEHGEELTLSVFHELVVRIELYGFIAELITKNND